MTRSKTQELLHETRPRIISAAERLFNERGYKGVSMQAIAEAVGHTPAALYYHFPAKEDIFLAVVDTFVTHHAQALQAAINAHVTLPEQLEAVAYLLMNKNVVAAMPTLIRDAHEHLNRERFEVCMGGTFSTYRDVVAGMFAAAQARGECTRTITPTDLSNLLFGMGMGMGGPPLLDTPLPSDEEYHRRARVVTATLLHGIAL